MATRLIIVDDSSPLIAYSHGWTVAPGLDNPAFGGAYLDTEHTTNITGSSLSFSFFGTYIRVFGSDRQTPIAGLPDKYYPEWECMIDESIGLRTGMGSRTNGNNFEVCVTDSLLADDREHTVTIRVTNTSGGIPFSIDRILYSPSAGDGYGADVTTLDAVSVRSDDPSFLFKGDWTDGNEYTRFTSTKGASVLFNFTGTRATWYGAYPHDFGHTGTDILVSVDSEPPRTIHLSPFTPNSDPKISLTNQVIYATKALEPGPHTLSLTYNEKTDVTKVYLSISHVVVSNASFPVPGGGSQYNSPPYQMTTTTTTGGSAGGTLSINSQPSSTNDSANVYANGGKKHVPIGTIIGAVVGGVILLFALVALYLLYRRRPRTEKHGTPHWSTSYFPSSFSSSPTDSNYGHAHTHQRFSRVFPILVTRSTLITTDDDYAYAMRRGSTASEVPLVFYESRKLWERSADPTPTSTPPRESLVFDR